ncbi:hypothetical protein BK124_30005 [Paenibacillus amylolyticus]|uniref:matrixin family metalloprotease n=1 Tax=Paenibacillus TaxID=44249 RepID=UPI00096D10E6|nr:matrixin family metalloprotease [Paenibacillus amylolyticus]OME89932.1 hypothetical protein BK124_30005 [Paenibacillus amylolyticus]
MKRKKIAVALTVLSSVVLFSSFVSADVFPKKRLEGKYSAWYDSSVSSYGYTGSVDAGRQSWNGISSKVNIGKTTVKTGNSTDEVYVGTTTDAETLGQAMPYMISWPANIIAPPNLFNWDYSVISLYHNTISAGKMNTNDLRKSIVSHEFGHALGLAHTTGSNASKSIMKPKSNSQETIFEPQTYDKAELKSKWGN